MKFLEVFEYLYNSQFELPVLSQTKLKIEEQSSSSTAGHIKAIRIRDFLIPVVVQLESQDKHIEQLLEIVEEAERIGLKFPSLEKYIRIHRNDYYEYAKYKSWKMGWLKDQKIIK